MGLWRLFLGLIISLSRAGKHLYLPEEMQVKEKDTGSKGHSISKEGSWSSRSLAIVVRRSYCTD